MENIKKITYTAEPTKNYQKTSLTIEIEVINGDSIKNSINLINTQSVEALKDLIEKVNKIDNSASIKESMETPVDVKVPYSAPVQPQVPSPVYPNKEMVKPHYSMPVQAPQQAPQQVVAQQPSQVLPAPQFSQSQYPNKDNDIISKTANPAMWTTLTINRIIDERTLSTYTIGQARDLLKQFGFKWDSGVKRYIKG